MANPYPRSQWIPEQPFDVADWGDKPDPWPDGLFRSEKELREATVASRDLPKESPRPK